MTRFSLEQIRAAYQEALPHPAQWMLLERALLAAKPEAKTCDHIGCRVMTRGADGATSWEPSRGCKVNTAPAAKEASTDQPAQPGTVERVALLEHALGQFIEETEERVAKLEARVETESADGKAFAEWALALESRAKKLELAVYRMGGEVKLPAPSPESPTGGEHHPRCERVTHPNGLHPCDCAPKAPEQPPAHAVTFTASGPPANATLNGRDVYVPPPADVGQPGVPAGFRVVGRSGPGVSTDWRRGQSWQRRDATTSWADGGYDIIEPIVPVEPSCPGNDGFPREYIAACAEEVGPPSRPGTGEADRSECNGTGCPCRTGKPGILCRPCADADCKDLNFSDPCELAIAPPAPGKPDVCASCGRVRKAPPFGHVCIPDAKEWLPPDRPLPDHAEDCPVLLGTSRNCDCGDSKPDEAPLSERISIVRGDIKRATMSRDEHGRLHSAPPAVLLELSSLHGLAAEVADLEAQLAARTASLAPPAPGKPPCKDTNDLTDQAPPSGKSAEKPSQGPGGGDGGPLCKSVSTGVECEREEGHPIRPGSMHAGHLPDGRLMKWVDGEEAPGKPDEAPLSESAVEEAVRALRDSRRGTMAQNLSDHVAALEAKLSDANHHAEMTRIERAGLLDQLVRVTADADNYRTALERSASEHFIAFQEAESLRAKRDAAERLLDRASEILGELDEDPDGYLDWASDFVKHRAPAPKATAQAARTAELENNAFNALGPGTWDGGPVSTSLHHAWRNGTPVYGEALRVARDQVAALEAKLPAKGW